MSQKIDIEYCGAWGYGGPALRLKKYVQAHFPDKTIDCHSANGATSKIEVGWVKEGNKNLVWSDGKAQTEKAH